GPDVDPDHFVTERAGELHGVVTEAAGGADDGDAAAGGHVVLAELLHRAVRGEAAAGQWSFVVTDRIVHHDQRTGVHGELLGERAENRASLPAQAWFAAETVVARTAPVAATATAQAENDAIADVDEPFGAGAQRFDDADRLVAEHARGRQPG